MGSYTKLSLLLILTINITTTEVTNIGNIPLYNVTYNLTTKFLYSPRVPAVSKIVGNLYSILENFFKEGCLVVINNFEGINVPKSDFPVILRRFTLAEIEVKFKFSWKDEVEYRKEKIWIPPELVSKLSGSYSKHSQIKTEEITNGDVFHDIIGLECPISKYYYYLSPTERNSGHCVGLNKTKFATALKTWQGEVQVDLFMPNDIFREGKHTQIFRLNTLINFLPSLRPPIHILVDGKLNVEKYEWLPLATWSTRHCVWYRKDTSLYGTVNDFQFTAHVRCDSKNHKAFNSVCNIVSLNVIYLCPFCKKYVLAKALEFKYLSHNYLTDLENDRTNIKFPVDIFDGEASQNKLTGRIQHYASYESEAIKHPFQNFHNTKLKNPGKVNLLGFAYASLLLNLVGNSTSDTSIKFSNSYHEHSGEFLCRTLYVVPMEVWGKGVNFQVENSFEALHFLSCGSRGVEAFQFYELLSVFEWPVWLSILTAIAALSLSIVLIYRNKHFSISISTLSIVKILLEQGDPLPANFANLRVMRCLMSGILVAGLVLSNAFKSENVYKIVLPRQEISYHYLDELIEDNFMLYSKVETIMYNFVTFFYPLRFSITKHLIDIALSGSVELIAMSEVQSSCYQKANCSRLTKVFEYSQIHPKIMEAITDPVKYLDDMFKVGFITSEDAERVIFSFALYERFWERQKDTIAKDLQNCNKTAWILQNVESQDALKSIRKSGKHSNVGVTAYNTPSIGFVFQESNVPSALISKISALSATGLLEWWPKFINRSDLIMRTEIAPKSPNMSGNILVVFIFLSGGMSVSIVCWVLEYSKILLNKFIMGYKFCFTKLQMLVNSKTRVHSLV